MKIPKKFLVKGSEENLQPCPACGFHTLSKCGGYYEICQICDWEDALEGMFLLNEPSAVNQISMAEWQVWVLQKFPEHERTWGDWKRATDWRPITQNDVERGPEMMKKFLESMNESSNPVSCYYWRW